MTLMKFPQSMIGFFGPRVYLPWCAYQLTTNPVVAVIGMRYGGDRVQVPVNEVMLGIALSTMLALIGFGITMSFMNPSHRGSFWAKLSCRELLVKRWESCTVAKAGNGLDASRADIVRGFSR